MTLGKPKSMSAPLSRVRPSKSSQWKLGREETFASPLMVSLRKPLSDLTNLIGSSVGGHDIESHSASRSLREEKAGHV